MEGLFAMAGRVRSGSTNANGIAAKAEVIEAVAVAAAEMIEKIREDQSIARMRVSPSQ